MCFRRNVIDVYEAKDFNVACLVSSGLLTGLPHFRRSLSGLFAGGAADTNVMKSGIQTRTRCLSGVADKGLLAAIDVRVEVSILRSKRTETSAFAAD